MHSPQLVGRFILVAGEEITQYLNGRGAHVNALNLAEAVSEQRGASLVEIFKKDLDSLRASSKAKTNPSYPGEVEMAWTQPVRP